MVLPLHSKKDLFNMFLKTKNVIKDTQYSTKIKCILSMELSRRTFFWNAAVPCGSENRYNVVQLNPHEDKYYLLTPYPTLMQPLKNKFSP